MVDVEPESSYGLTCGRRLFFRSGLCPVHGSATEPNVFDHPEPNADTVANSLSDLLKKLGLA
jgi:hypothetical protein